MNKQKGGKMRLSKAKWILIAVGLVFSSFFYIGVYSADDYIPIPQIAVEKNYSQDETAGIATQSWTYEISWSWDEIAEHFKTKAPLYDWQTYPPQGQSRMSETFKQNSVMFTKDDKLLTVNNLPALSIEGPTTVFAVSISESTGERIPWWQSAPRVELPTEMPPLPEGIDLSQTLTSFFDSKPFNQLVDDVPVYPGSNQLMSNQQGKMIAATFTSSEDPSRIEGFYSDKMTQKGWSFVQKLDSKALSKDVQMVQIPTDETCPTCKPSIGGLATEDLTKVFSSVDFRTMRFKKEGKRCDISVMPLGSVGTTMISINYFEEESE